MKGKDFLRQAKTDVFNAHGCAFQGMLKKGF